MKNAILVLMLSFLSITTVFAKDFKIEKDAVFKVMLEEFKNPGSNLALYQESENYRLDLSIIDLIDKGTLVLNNIKFGKYQSELENIINNDGVHFYDWFIKLKEIADTDEELFKKLDKKLYLQLYSKSGIALLPEYKYIDFKKIKEIGLRSRISKYNNFISNTEGIGLRALFEKTEHAPFVTKELTVAKMKHVSHKTLKKLRKSYFKEYRKVLRGQQKVDLYGTKLMNVVFPITRNGVKARAVNLENVVERDYQNGIKVFNIINSVSHKQELLSYLVHDLKNEKLVVPRVRGHLIMTPAFIENNWKKVKESLQEYTLEKSVNLDDDEYMFLVRKWVKRNHDLIQTELNTYNDNNKTILAFISKPNRKPRRLDTLKQYDVLEKLFPTRPWMRKDNPDLVDAKGRAKYFGISSGKKFGLKFKALLRNLGKTETYTSILAGTAVLISTGGNVALSMSTRSLVKKAVYTLKHDKEWEEFLKEAPMELVSAFLLGSGFTAGRLYKILALGSAQGALQSYVTGQDIKTGAIVGAGMSLLNHYVLPYSLAKPMTKGFDAKSLRTNRLLEITGTTIKNSIQGTLVASLTGENPLRGALKGAAFGAVSSSLAIWFLGTRYHPFKDFTDEDLDAMIDAENHFQNDVGRGGEFNIDRQLMLDANHRVGGALPAMISASITLPGNISMSRSGFERLTTLTHEGHHLMQQHQSGVFGFYLFRYLPTSLATGYNGHPDENFLRNALAEYLGG